MTVILSSLIFSSAYAAEKDKKQPSEADLISVNGRMEYTKFQKNYCDKFSKSSKEAEKCKTENKLPLGCIIAFAKGAQDAEAIPCLNNPPQPICASNAKACPYLLSKEESSKLSEASKELNDIKKYCYDSAQVSIHLKVIASAESISDQIKLTSDNLSKLLPSDASRSPAASEAIPATIPK